MRVLARSRSDGLLSLWSLTNGNFHDSFETESKVKNFIDRPNVAGLAWLSALKFIETKQKGLDKHCWMIYKILYMKVDLQAVKAMKIFGDLVIYLTKMLF